jgi:hypothetical protein
MLFGSPQRFLGRCADGRRKIEDNLLQSWRQCAEVLDQLLRRRRFRGGEHFSGDAVDAFAQEGGHGRLDGFCNSAKLRSRDTVLPELVLLDLLKGHANFFAELPLVHFDLLAAGTNAFADCFVEIVVRRTISFGLDFR